MFLRMLLVIVVFAAGGVTAGEAAGQSNGQHPSFACEKTESSIELIICADAKLADWDARMGRAYKLSLTRLTGDEQRVLTEAQDQWIASRNAQCNQLQLAMAKPCILQLTKSRIEALQATNKTAAKSEAVSNAPRVSTVAPTLSQIWEWCAGSGGGSPNLQIRGCTTVINSGQETPENVAIAFGNRGNGFQTNGDYDRAIAEYDQAIQRNPNDPIVFNNRGIAYKSKGDVDRALMDFSEAIRLDPNFAEALAHRGLLKLKKGDASATADIANALSLKPALAEEVTRQQAMMAAQPSKRKGVPHVPPGAATTSISTAGPSSKKRHVFGPQPECLPGQRCH